MATPTYRLVSALRHTADRLGNPDVLYRWSDFAHCNCGQLIRTITGLEPRAIQQRAMVQELDWGQQAHQFARKANQEAPRPDYGDRPPLDEVAWEPENIGACSVTGVSLDLVFEMLGDYGLDHADVDHLERLSDPDVRGRLGNPGQEFAYHQRENVVAYFRAWADLLEEQLPAKSMRCSSKETENRLAVGI